MGTVAQRLNELLEAERAGAEVASQLLAEATDAELRDFWSVCARTKRGAVRGLCRPSPARVRPYRAEKGISPRRSSPSRRSARLRLLNRGQGWVVKRLGELLSEAPSPEVAEFLDEMKQRHVASIEAYNRFLERLDERPLRGGAL